MIDIIQNRLAQYSISRSLDEQNALKEISQEIILFSLMQYGPWKEQSIIVDQKWLENALSEKISSINWKNAVADVERFIKPIEQKSLSLWSEKFFLSKVDTLGKLFQG